MSRKLWTSIARHRTMRSSKSAMACGWSGPSRPAESQPSSSHQKSATTPISEVPGGASCKPSLTASRRLHHWGHPSPPGAPPAGRVTRVPQIGSLALCGRSRGLHFGMALNAASHSIPIAARIGVLAIHPPDQAGIKKSPKMQRKRPQIVLKALKAPKAKCK